MDDLDKNCSLSFGKCPHDSEKTLPARVSYKPRCVRAHPPLEKAGTIAGYTVLLGRQGGPGAIEAPDKRLGGAE